MRTQMMERLMPSPVDVVLPIGSVEFAAMGSACQIMVTGVHGTRTCTEVLAIGRALVETLEQRWSRFLSASDVSRLNRQAGEWVDVDRYTCDAITLADAGRTYTDGRFNPLVGVAMIEVGYDRPFPHVSGAPDAPVGLRDRLGAGSIEGALDVDRAARRVRIPPATRLDLGGIGKGYAGDLVVDALLALGATGVMVNLGGDVRVSGEAPGPLGHWSVQVGDLDEVVLLDDGAVAYSSTERRRWLHDGVAVHHLIDPSTATSIPRDLSAVVVVSGAGWWSEVLTKAVAVDVGRLGAYGQAASALGCIPSGCHASLSVDGRRSTTSEWDSISARYERSAS